MKIAFVGLGNMGLPMAKNLLDADFDVVGFDIDTERMQELADAGGHRADSATDAVSGADVVITVVRTPDQVKGICDDIFPAMSEGTLYIDMSTIGPKAVEEINKRATEREIRMLDAPVSGGVEGAKDGTLAIMVGGDSEDFTAAEPLFESMGNDAVHVGESGAGQIVKLCNQLLVGSQLVSIAEAFRLADAADVDLETTYDVLTSAIGSSGILEVKGQRILEEDYEPGADINIQHKDTQMVMELGEQLDVPLYSTSIVAQAFIHARQRGLGEKDHLILFELFDEELPE